MKLLKSSVPNAINGDNLFSWEREEDKEWIGNTLKIINNPLKRVLTLTVHTQGYKCFLFW